MGELPDTAMLRPGQVASKKGKPGLLPVSESTLWRWVQAGKFPRPVKLSERVSAWKVGTVRAWLAAQGN